MFCIAFGLSMDYGVFLLSRIKEEYDHTGDHEHAVRFGLQRTGGLITAAAVILAVVMVAIGTSRVTNTKMLGLGIALAVLMDAMVVRSLLVPAVMKLTGRATWWAPGPLRRFHERFGLSEGEIPQPAPQPDPESDPTARSRGGLESQPRRTGPERTPTGRAGRADAASTPDPDRGTGPGGQVVTAGPQRGRRSLRRPLFPGRLATQTRIVSAYQ